MKKSKFFIQYSIGDKSYNYILKAKSLEDAIEKFDKLWLENFGMVYPYQDYKITFISKIINKLKF